MNSDSCSVSQTAQGYGSMIPDTDHFFFLCLCSNLVYINIGDNVRIDETLYSLRLLILGFPKGMSKYRYS